MDSGRWKPVRWPAWVFLLWLAWALWLWRLDASDLTFDEAATYWVIHRPWLDILNYLRGAVREHPPVYYMLIRAWTALCGASEFSLRSFSAGAGLAALVLTGWLARLASPTRRHRRALGLIAAILLAAMPGMAWYAREARMYSLGIVWTTLSAGLFLRDWFTTEVGVGTPTYPWPRRQAILGLATVHLLALLTHYYLLLPMLAQPLALLLTRRRRPLAVWCAVHLLPALAGLSWFWLSPALQNTAGDVFSRFRIPAPTAFQVLHLTGKVLFSPVMQLRFPILYWQLALIALAILATFKTRRSLAAWLGLALGVPLVVAYWIPNPPQPRYLVCLLPCAALALSLACALPLCFPSHTFTSLFSFILTLFVSGTLARGGLRETILYDRSHYGHTLTTVKAHARPGDALIFYGPWQEILFHYYDPGGLPPITSLPPYAPPHLNPAEAEPTLRALLTQHERLWVIYAAVDDVDPTHFVERWLRANACLAWDTADFSLYLPLPSAGPARSLDIAFGQALRLESAVWPQQALPAGQPFCLTFLWDVRQSPASDARVTLDLRNAGGVWGQVQRAIPGGWAAGGQFLEHEGLIVPPGAPPGEYTLHLALDEAGGARRIAEADLFTLTVAEPISPPVRENLPHPDAATFCAASGACLTLAGYEPGGLRFQQGNPVPLTLHWLAPQQPLPDLRFRLQIARAGISQLLSSPDYPTSAWQPGRLVTLPALLMLPLDAPAGAARVTLEVLGPDGSPWQVNGRVGRGTYPYTLFRLRVDERPVRRRLPGGLTRVWVNFADEEGTVVELRGYRLEGEARPGGQLRITYAWRANRRPTAIYAVFNHLFAADGTYAAQADGWPQGGRMLTTQWQAGEYIEDGYVMDIPPDAPPGPYTLYTGLYNAATGDRLQAWEAGQRLADDRVALPLAGIGTQR